MEEKRARVLREQAEFLKLLGQAVKHKMEIRNMTQTQLSKQCCDNGCKVGQSTISNILNGVPNVSLKMIMQVLEILEIDLYQLLEREERERNPLGEHLVSLLSSNPEFVLDPYNRKYEGILGTYYTYCYTTNKNQDHLLEGNLIFKRANGYCHAELSVLVPMENAKITTKKFEGFLILSQLQVSGYCYLVGEQTAEILYFTFRHMPPASENMPIMCKMAAMATTSSGIEGRLPTIERFFFSRKQLDQTELRYLKAQLKLNKSQIIISRSNYEKMIDQEPAVTKAFAQMVKLKGESETFYVLDESDLKYKDGNLSAWMNMVSILRDYSIAAKNNKVNPKVDANIFYAYVKE